MLKTILTILQIVGALGILSFFWSIFLYRENRKYKKFDAERELVKKEIEHEEMTARHQVEYRDLLSQCEGEIRERDNVRINTLTMVDNKKLGELCEKQQREERALYAEMEYFDKILGKHIGLLIMNQTLWSNIKWQTHRLLRKLKDSNKKCNLPNKKLG